MEGETRLSMGEKGEKGVNIFLQAKLLRNYLVISAL